MVFSPTTLVKLQRLARTAKKDLNLTTKLASESSVAALIARVSTVPDNQIITALYDDFKETLTAEDEALLAKHRDGIEVVEPFTEREVANIREAAEEEEALRHQRLYRGSVVHTEMLSDEPRKSALSVEESAHLHERIYRGNVIHGEERAAPADTEKVDGKKRGRKQIGMYRGQPVYEDD